MAYRKTLIYILLTTLITGCSATAPLDQQPDSTGEPSNASHEVPNVDTKSADRKQLDATVWSDEVKAQTYERPFTQLWDNLRTASDPWQVLLNAVSPNIRLGSVLSSENLELGMRHIRFGAPDRNLTSVDFTELVDRFRQQGFRLVESEWHHSRFVPAELRSEFGFALHVQRIQTPNTKELRAIVRGTLVVDWEKQAATPTAQAMQVRNAEILTRSGPPAFERVLTYSRRKTDVSSAHPILLHDLDGNGFDDIVISRWNRAYLNGGDGRFVERPFLEHFEQHGETGTIADFDGDGAADFLTVAKTGKMMLFRGNESGEFKTAARVVADTDFVAPLAVTVGDIDADGDLDVWQTQYRLSYLDGHMPTPYYDANDGFPAALLLNDGTGSFTDTTTSAGLDGKRFRRTYSTSFVDLDDDNDLDLIVVSDFAGLDAYLNDGQGRFSDATQAMFGETHLFGMSHTMADYNLDGRLDLYTIGMSSTTARRLDHMNLGRSDRPEVHRMRAAMGFGNRMFLKPQRLPEQQYAEPEFAKSVARTGWSWGTSSFDFDNDGDSDIYVANGFRSGRSSRDYCTRFWCHDIYTGSSQADPQVKSILAESLRELDSGTISWNGFEHNAMLVNLGGKDFVNVGFLMGVGFEFDSRAVATNDLDGDGNPDLLVTQYTFDGKGFLMDLHVYRNRLTTANRWIGVRLDRSVPPGTKVRLHAGGTTQIAHVLTGDSFGSQHGKQIHFGLGPNTEVDRIEIQRPDGTTSNTMAPETDKYHTIQAPDKSSRGP